MRGIKTTFKGATNSTGSRIVASCDGARKTMPYNHGLNGPDNHKEAAEALVEHMGWNDNFQGTLQSGFLVNGNYVHVLVPFKGRVR